MRTGLLDLPAHVRLLVLDRLMLPDKARVRCVCKLLKGEIDTRICSPHGAHLVAVTKQWDTVAVKLLTGELTALFNVQRFDISDPMAVSKYCCGTLGSKTIQVIVGIPLLERWTILQGRYFSANAEKPFLHVLGNNDFFVSIVEPDAVNEPMVHVYSSQDEDWVTTPMVQQGAVVGGEPAVTVECAVFDMQNNELLLGGFDVRRKVFVRVQRAPPEMVERLLLWQQRWFSYKPDEVSLTICELRASEWASVATVSLVPGLEFPPFVHCVQVGDFAVFTVWSGSVSEHRYGFVYNFRTGSFLHKEKRLDIVLYGFIHE